MYKQRNVFKVQLISYLCYLSKKHLYEIDSDMYKINLFKSLNEIVLDKVEI